MQVLRSFESWFPELLYLLHIHNVNTFFYIYPVIKLTGIIEKDEKKKDKQHSYKINFNIHWARIGLDIVSSSV